MRVYAERPGRIARQVLGDLLALGWIAGWAFVGFTVYTAVLLLQSPADALVTAGDRIRSAFDGAAQGASNIPFVGDQVAGSLRPGTDAGISLAAVGQQTLDALPLIAAGAGVLLAVLGALPVVVLWLFLRTRYARTASAAVRARAAGGEILALRALNSRPVSQLHRISADPAGDWRRGDAEVVAALASLELRSLGLRRLADPAT